MKGRRLLLLLASFPPALAFVASGTFRRRSPLATTSSGADRTTSGWGSCRQKTAFSQRRPQEETSLLVRCSYSNRRGSDHHDSWMDPELQSRLDILKIQALEKTYRMAPNPNLSAVETVSEVLHSLYSCDDPSPDAGIRSLLRSSTWRWKQLLYQSVGATTAAASRRHYQHNHHQEESHVVSALRSSMGRPNNQFRILVEDDDQEAYNIVFPSEPVDYMDGTCWVECQLRRRTDDKLLIMMGWQLEKEHGCWMVDHIDWQDFRDAFRPGIGREEWVRICG